MKGISTSRSIAGATLGLLLAAGIATSALADQPDKKAAATVAASARATGTATFADRKNDVRPTKLDIRKVTVKNTAKTLKVRVYFPGQEKTYDFPFGAISVFLDTDRTRKGPEYGHFMDFWSDYRFAPTKGWREQRVRAWMHSPDGRCVQYAGLSSDKESRLKWFEYIVEKTDGCFQAGAVRVAVTSITTGTKVPPAYYAKKRFDHLGKRHQWSAWVPQAS